MEYKDSRKYCVGCVYFYGDYEVTRCCNYIFLMGKRPCGPGEKCEIKREKTRKEKRA